MSADGKWLAELYRIGTLRRWMHDLRMGLLAASIALFLSACIDYLPIRFVVCLIGAAFAASSLGTLSALTDKMDRDHER